MVTQVRGGRRSDLAGMLSALIAAVVGVCIFKLSEAQLSRK